jgi:hypothetical protein
MATTFWEYCILTRLSAGLDTKWHLNRVFKHTGIELPREITDEAFAKYNALFDKLHAAAEFPILPAVLNILGRDGWELIDDMGAGMPGGEGLVFKRPIPKPAARATRRAPARRAARKR